jgi:hypothetical protein
VTPAGHAAFPEGRWLCVDPGETVGWSVWKKDRMLGGGQTPLWEFGHGVFDSLLLQRMKGKTCPLMAEAHDPFLRPGAQPWLGAGVDGRSNQGDISLIVCERFALYEDKAQDLIGDEFRTSQLIGWLFGCTTLFDVRFHKQSAAIKKGALDAGAREFFVKPVHENRHQNDSIMHAFFYLAVECRGATIHVPGGST